MRTTFNPFTPSSLNRYEGVVFFALVMYQTLILFNVATDLNGDPNDYLNLARNFFSIEIFSNFNRFIGYPLFIKITSLNLGLLNLTFIAQEIIFLVSLRYFAFSISNKPFTRTLIYLPAFLPVVSYLPKLLFPDCLLLSLFLLLCASLLRKNFIVSGLIVFALSLIKLVFIFTFLFWGALMVASYFPRRVYATLFCYCVLLALLVPAVFLAAPFPLYQTTVQNPQFVLEREKPNPLPVYARKAIKCSNEYHKLDGVLSDQAITEHSSDALYMPIGKDLALEWGCSKNDIKDFQRRLILESLISDPNFHALKFFNRFLRDVFVLPDAQHVWWMLDTKLHLEVTYEDMRSYYSESELEYFKSQGMSPFKQPNVRLLASMVQINPILQQVLSWIVIIFFIAWLVFSFRLRYFSRDALLLIAALISYNFVISFFAFGYDRYILVNYFLWFGLIGLSMDSFKKSFSRDC